MGLQNLYYANSLRNLNMKICAYFPQIPNFEFDARSVPIILEHSNFYSSVFTPIHILFMVLRKFLRKKRFFDTPYFTFTLHIMNKQNLPILLGLLAVEKETKYMQYRLLLLSLLSTYDNKIDHIFTLFFIKTSKL